MLVICQFQPLICVGNAAGQTETSPKVGLKSLRAICKRSARSSISTSRTRENLDRHNFLTDRESIHMTEQGFGLRESCFAFCHYLV